MDFPISRDQQVELFQCNACNTNMWTSSGATILAQKEPASWLIFFQCPKCDQHKMVMIDTEMRFHGQLQVNIFSMSTDINVEETDKLYLSGSKITSDDVLDFYEFLQKSDGFMKILGTHPPTNTRT